VGYLDKKKTSKYYNTVRHQAKEDFGYGADLLRQTVSGLDSLDADFSGQIGRGGLTPEMEREFEVARGRISDDVARSRRGWGADLMQAGRRSGGTFDANTAMAYQLEREGDLDQARFGAENDVSFQKAAARMERTDKLYQMILAVRDRKGALSQDERNRAANMWLGAIGGQANYKVGVASAAASVFGSVSGRGGGGGGNPEGGKQW
jgi:hypothetical protein